MPQVLRHQVDLFRALRLELLRLAHQADERLGAMLAAHQRNGAEGAGVVAAFRDLEITHVRLIAEELSYAGMLGDGIGDQTPPGKLGDEMMELRKAEKQIDLRNLLLQFLLVSLNETTDRDDRLHAAFLQFGSFEHRIDRLLLGRIDKAAGIDQNHVGTRQVGCNDGAVPDQLAHEPFRVDRRFVAAEGDDAQLHPPPR